MRGRKKRKNRKEKFSVLRSPSGERGDGVWHYHARGVNDRVWIYRALGTEVVELCSK